MTDQSQQDSKERYNEEEWYIGSDGHHHRVSNRGKHPEDLSERFENENLRSSKRRKLWGRVLFTAGCVIALFIVIAVIYLYLFV